MSNLVTRARAEPIGALAFLPEELKGHCLGSAIVPDFAVRTPRGSVTMVYFVANDKIRVTATERGKPPIVVDDYFGSIFHLVVQALMFSARKPEPRALSKRPRWLG